MTRKDYLTIADAIKRSAEHETREGRNAIAGAAAFVANAMRRNNERFEKARFMEACGFSAAD